MIALLAFCAFGSTPALAAPVRPDATLLAAAWSEQQAMLQQHGRIPVDLSSQDLALVAGGGIARHRDRLQGLDRVIGATWTAIPRDQLWVAILDDTCFTLVEGLTERHLAADQALQKILFQHVDVPWPFTDRQWIIDIRSNGDLFQASAGQVWERSWTLVDGSEARQAELRSSGSWPDPDAIWTPVNEGGWLLVNAAGGTLVVYHARVDVGGALPEEASTAWAMATLRGLLGRVLERAAVVETHYDIDHAAILRPDGGRVQLIVTNGMPRGATP